MRILHILLFALNEWRNKISVTYFVRYDFKDSSLVKSIILKWNLLREMAYEAATWSQLAQYLIQ